MKKSDIGAIPPYYERYSNLVDEDAELSQAFDRSVQQLENLDKSLLTMLGRKTYAPGKWTIKEIFQHLVDWERILSYRALLYARNKGAVGQEIDGDLFAANMNAEQRAIEELIDELKIVRSATRAMFESFDAPVLLNTGVCWKYEMSVLAMGFTIIGHQIYHLKIIEEKYFPLVRTTGL